MLLQDCGLIGQFMSATDRPVLRQRLSYEFTLQGQRYGEAVLTKFRAHRPMRIDGFRTHDVIICLRAMMTAGHAIHWLWISLPYQHFCDVVRPEQVASPIGIFTMHSCVR